MITVSAGSNQLAKDSQVYTFAVPSRAVFCTCSTRISILISFTHFFKPSCHRSQCSNNRDYSHLLHFPYTCNLILQRFILVNLFQLFLTFSDITRYRNISDFNPFFPLSTNTISVFRASIFLSHGIMISDKIL